MPGCSSVTKVKSASAMSTCASLRTVTVMWNFTHEMITKCATPQCSGLYKNYIYIYIYIINKCHLTRHDIFIDNYVMSSYKQSVMC